MTITKQLAKHPRLNLWLGPGCSQGLSAWWGDSLSEYLHQRHPSFSTEVALEVALASLDRQARGELESIFSGINFTYAAIVALAESDRVGAIVLRNMDGILPRALARKNLLPPIHSELDGDIPGDLESPVTLFELPVVREPDRWVDLLKANGGNPWIVAGVDAPLASELELLRHIAGSPVYWIPLWHGEAPMGQNIPGYDPDSFFLALAHAATGYLPGNLGNVPGDIDNPEKAVEGALQRDVEDWWKSKSEAPLNLWTGYESFVTMDDAEFVSAVALMKRDLQKRQRMHPSTPPDIGTVEWFHAAKRTGGKRADTLLALAAEQHKKRVPPKENFRIAVDIRQSVTILHARGKLRRPDAAEPFYREAYQAIQALPANEPRNWNVANDLAQMLADWSANKGADEADRLIGEAVQILEHPFADGPLKDFEAQPLLTTQATILKSHALRQPLPHARRKYFQQAGASAERLRPLSGGDFLAEYMLGMFHFEEAAMDQEAEQKLIAQGTAHFEAALAIRQAALALADWGTAWAKIGKRRDADEPYFQRAFELFARAAEESSAFTLAHNNWGAFLEHRAQRTTNPSKREAFLSEAWDHAMKAETRSPGTSAENLAGIAAQRRDWDTMKHWLRIAARSSKFPSISHIDSDAAFDSIRNEPWFQSLLAELYP